MEMGEELRDLLKEARAPSAAGAGEQERDLRGVPGVPGGVTPFPLAREAPITLTSSLTETPWRTIIIRISNGKNTTKKIEQKI